MVKHKKPKQLSNKKKKSKNKNKDDAPKKIPSMAELMDAGDAAIASGESDKALEFFLSAQQIRMTTKDVISAEQQILLLEKLGETRATLGDRQAARRDFESAIALLLQNPQADNDAHHQETLASFHLYVGQLSCEHEALEAYQKGLKCLEASVELRQRECAKETERMETEEVVDGTAENPVVALNEVRQKLASARVTVAELYLTDLCFEDNAEEECESHVLQALQVTDSADGEPMVDALQTAASLRLSQQRPKEALAFILRAYQKMQIGCEALASLVGLGRPENAKSKRAVELLEVDAAHRLPSLEFRSQTAKLLLECAAAQDDITVQQASDCHQAAIEVLGSLMAENDEVPEVWYLLGCAFQASKNTETAKYYWNRALEMLESVQKQMEEACDGMDREDDEDDEGEELEAQLQAIASQMEEIKSKLEDLQDEDEEDEKEPNDAKMEE